MVKKRVIMEFDPVWIDGIKVSDEEIKSKAALLKTSKSFTDSILQTWLIKAINCVDLALLGGNETPDSIRSLCQKAAYPLQDVSNGDGSITKTQCAAVCIYPLRIEDAITSLTELNSVKSLVIAAVAAGFPTGQFPLHTRLAEIYYAVATGAEEIDVVIDRSLVLRGLWQQLYDELCEMRKACGKSLMKVILSVSECGSLTNVYKVSVVAMLAGCDFIKTSTGKEAALMTIHDGLVMCQAIKDFYDRTGFKVGIKPSGGIRTVDDISSWMYMVKDQLGEEWLDPALFRIGTSSTSALIDNVAKALSSNQ